MSVDAKVATSRRRLLIGAATLAGLPLLAAAGQAAAAGTVAQAAAKYRPTPNGANRCGKCNYFLPGSTADGPGQCKVVQGAISPNGWCQLFAPKHA